MRKRKKGTSQDIDETRWLMTLLETFKEKIENGESVIDAFKEIDNYTLKYCREKNLEITYEVVEFCDYFMNDYEEMVEEIYETFSEEPYVFFLYDLVNSVRIDNKLLELIEEKETKRLTFELNKFKKNIEEIFEKFGTLNICKNGFINIDDTLKIVKNDIYIQSKEQINSTMTNNFLKVSLLLDYSIVNVITFDEEKNSNVIISYHTYNHSWKPITKEQMTVALDNIDSFPCDDIQFEVYETQKQY